MLIVKYYKLISWPNYYYYYYTLLGYVIYYEFPDLCLYISTLIRTSPQQLRCMSDFNRKNGQKKSWW